MKLILSRHGESEENTRKIMPIPSGKLNDDGKDQARNLGQSLAAKKIKVIYYSPDLKCQETIDILKKYLPGNIELICSELIRERDFGDLSGIPLSKISFDEIDQDTQENQNFGVETLDSLKQRISQFINQLNSHYADETVLIISHTSTLNMLLALLHNISFGESLEKFPLKSAVPFILDLQSVRQS